MTTQTNILELPLRLVGISDQVTDWLQQAGFPVMHLGQQPLMKSAFPQRPATSSSKTRCLLYDSRDLWSRTIAKQHQHQGLCKFDIAKWFSRGQSNAENPRAAEGVANQVRISFLEQFKKSLETAGGIWARVADLPFPYQAWGCVNGHLPDGTGPDHPHRLDLVQKRYIAGLPSEISTDDLPALAALPPVSGLQSQGLPLLWRADANEFATWWKQRSQLKLKLWQSATHYLVDCPHSNLEYCPVLEIWRGQHLASVPLRSQSVVVRKDGLVFQQQSQRHPAGFTAGWPNQDLEKSGTRLSA